MDEIINIPIYWDDLTEEKREEIAACLGIETDKAAASRNWDVLPMTFVAC